MDLLALFIGLELFYRKFPRLVKATSCFVDATIRATANKADDLISFIYTDFALIRNMAAVSIDGF
jgi:hypothetical protein